LLLLLLLQPAPPLVAAIKAEKQLTPQHQRQHREKRRATSQSQEKTPTQKSLHPRLNTHRKGVYIAEVLSGKDSVDFTKTLKFTVFHLRMGYEKIEVR
jgi:hypothetical protein